MNPPFDPPHDGRFSHPRRRFLTGAAIAGGAAALGLLPSLRDARAAADRPDTPHAHDWDWLRGNWDVHHRRLKERLVGDTRWEEFAGRSATWLTMGGLGTIDDNSLELPGGSYRGLGLRVFDPETAQWAIWWLDGRDPTRIDPAVRGGFDGDTGTFTGRDTLRGQPILMRFRWNDIHGQRPWWEQAFSPDDGASWEVNWRNWFTRTSGTPGPLPMLPDAPTDFSFLAGRWKVRNRRLRERLVGNDDWDEFDGTLNNWPVLGGYGNVGDNVMHFPGGDVRGVSVRSYDPETGRWLSWWIDSRNPSRLDPPVGGRFATGDDSRVLIGDDTLRGRPIKTRVVWSHITGDSPRWEQSCSADGGESWELNWVSDFVRVG